MVNKKVSLPLLLENETLCREVPSLHPHEAQSVLDFKLLVDEHASDFVDDVCDERVPPLFNSDGYHVYHPRYGQVPLLLFLSP